MAKKPRNRQRAVAALLVIAAVALFVFGGIRRDEPLRVPVQGVRAVDLRSTWHARRSGGRQHQGADIFAPRGTPVLAATRGTVLRVGVDSLGGKVVWVLGPGPTLFYYAHLDDWHEVAPGRTVSAGRLLGFVGNTGNARSTPSHLHFGVYRVGFFSVKAVDPVPLLLRSVAPVPSSRVRQYRQQQRITEILQLPKTRWAALNSSCQLADERNTVLCALTPEAGPPAWAPPAKA